jgi:hypothetical protein
MSFWEDASPVLKGTIVFGVVALLVVLAMNLMGGSGADTTPERAVTSGSYE